MSSGTEKSTVHSEAEAERCASLLQILLPSKHRTSGFMHLREITGKRMISCTYEIGKVVT